MHEILFTLWNIHIRNKDHTVWKATQFHQGLLYWLMNKHVRTFSSRNHYENKPIQIYWRFYHKKKKKKKKKNENFQIKIRIFQNIDSGYSLEPPMEGGSNEYPQSIFLSRNKNNNIYPCKPQFYYTKVGLRGLGVRSTLYRHVCVTTGMYGYITDIVRCIIISLFFQQYYSFLEMILIKCSHCDVTINVSYMYSVFVHR